MSRASISLLAVLLTTLGYGQAPRAYLFECATAELVEHKRILSALADHDEKPQVVVDLEQVKLTTSDPLSEDAFRSFLIASGLEQCRYRVLRAPGDGSGATVVTNGFIGIGADRRATVTTDR